MAQSKKKGASKNKRVIEQYCSVCQETFDMKVVDEAENDEVLWLKCPGCEGYLPFMTAESGANADANNEEGNAQADEIEGIELAPEDIDRENAIEYQKSNEYNIDDIIYHRSWNDYGKVVAKEVLPGHRKTIVVHFVNQGKIRLLEGVT
ncbi:MAG: hypothetical protein JXB45_06325 [Candidatus Krumholzibacteriota bacterium]|nr:hypothetical protein [Candidatus Krumholzibacteriota bacterium]